MVSSLSWAQSSDRLHLDTTTSTHPPSLTGASGAGARSCGGSSAAPRCSPCRRRCRLNARLLLTVRTPRGPPMPPHPPQRSRAMQRAQPGRLRCKACPTRALNHHTAVAEERAQETPRAFPTLRTPAVFIESQPRVRYDSRSWGSNGDQRRRSPCRREACVFVGRRTLK